MPVGQNEQVRTAIQGANSNQEMIEILKQATLSRFENILREAGQFGEPEQNGWERPRIPRSFRRRFR